MNKFYLFSYGTLMDKQIQKILFEQKIKMVDATLEDYKVYADIDGYFYVKEDIGNVIHGKVLELAQEQIWIADQWEEVPKYLRKKVNVKIKDEKYKDVFLYKKTNVESEIEIKSDSISDFPLEEVIKVAKDFKKQLNAFG
jgi:gamma-glutamylcyclotransferase (GGCT)/AIG2-like uncharacterized protein YtfP